MSLNNNNSTSEPEFSQVKESSTTIINDQRIVEEESARVFASTPASASAVTIVSEEEYNLKQTFSKPIMLGQFDWTTSQVQHQLLAKYDISDILKTNPSQPYSLQRIFKILQYGVDVEIMSQGTIYHQGTLIAFFNPMDTCKVPVNAYSVSGFPNIVIDASIGTPGRIHIPFAHIFPFLRTGDGISGYPNTIGTLSILVLNPLEIGTGASPTVPITVYATPRDPELRMAIYDHDPVGPAAQNIINNTPEAEILDRVEKGARGIKGLLQQGEKVLKDIFCDNPEAYGYSGVIPQSNASFNHTTAAAYSEVLDPCPSYGYFPQKAVTNGQQGEEHSISSIIKIPMLVSTITWSTTDTPETDLVNTFVTPMNASEIVSPIEPDTLRSFQPTFLSNMGFIHAFWDGDIRYTFHMIKTKFVTGRLLIAFVPLEERISPTYTIQQLQACPNMVIDVKDDKVIYDFIVPYVGNTPRKYVAPVVPVNYTGDPPIYNAKFLVFNDDANSFLTSGSTYSSMYHSGKLVVKVLNRLTAPPGVASNIHFNVYVSAGPSFSYHNATLPEGFFDRQFVPISNNPQSAETPDSSMSRSSHEVGSMRNALQLGDSARMSSPGYKVPEHDSLLTHLKRYYVDAKNTFNTAIVDHTSTFLISPMSSTLDLVNTPNFNLRDFIVGQYVFYTGSQKYMILTNVNKNMPLVGTVTHIYDTKVPLGTLDELYPDTHIYNYPTQFLNLTTSPAHHVNTTYRSPYNQLLVPDVLATTPAPPNSPEYPFTTTTGYLMFTVQSTGGPWTTDYPQYFIYLNHAVGDDFTLNYLRSPRPIVCGKLYLGG